LTFGGQVLRRDPQPTRHRTATHHGDTSIRSVDQPVCLVRVHADKYSALAASRYRHVAADQKGEASKHLLLPESRLTLEQFSDAFSQRLVVSHGRNLDRTPQALPGPFTLRDNMKAAPPSDSQATQEMNAIAANIATRRRRGAGESMAGLWVARRSSHTISIVPPFIFERRTVLALSVGSLARRPGVVNIYRRRCAES